MVVRKYREIGFSKMVAGIIRVKLLSPDKSDGWQGSLEELSQVEKILSAFNIYYVNDFVRRMGAQAKERAKLLNIKHAFGCRC